MAKIMDEIYFSHDAFGHFTKKAKCHENTQGTSRTYKEW